MSKHAMTLYDEINKVQCQVDKLYLMENHIINKCHNWVSRMIQQKMMRNDKNSTKYIIIAFMFILNT